MKTIAKGEHFFAISENMMRFNSLNYLTKEVGFGKWRHSKKKRG